MDELSYHSKIVSIFKEGLSIKNEDENDNYSWKQRATLYKLDETRKKNYALKNCQKEIEEIEQRIDAGLIHSTGELIQQLFIKTAKATLEEKGKKVSTNWKRRKRLTCGLTTIVSFFRKRSEILEIRNFSLHFIILCERNTIKT